MAFNTGIDADLTKVYNGQYGFPFNHGETYTNPNNQTFPFVEVDTGYAVNLIPGTGLGLNRDRGKGSTVAGPDGGGRVAGAYFGDGKTACIAAAGGTKKGVWVQSGGRPAGDIWYPLASVNGTATDSTPNTGVSGQLGFASAGVSTVAELAVGALGGDVHSNLSLAAGGVAATYAGDQTGDALSNAATAVIRGFHKTSSPILILRKDFTDAASATLVGGYTVGKYLNIGDESLTSGYDVNAITVQILRQITDSVSGNVIGAVGKVVGATDASGADITSLYYGTPTQTTAGSGDYSKITGTGAGGATATVASRDEDYVDQTGGTGLNFYLGIDSALATLTC